MRRVRPGPSRGARFRGPNGEGAAADAAIPIQWSDKDYDFRVALPGMGHSSPVVWEKRIFLLSADAEDATLYVLCLDADSGQTVWRRDFPSAAHPKHAFNTFASSTPAVDQQHVYIAWANPRQTTLLALDHEGQVVWQQDLGPFVSQHAFGTSPIVWRDLVVLASDQQAEQLEGDTPPGESHVFALDRQTGQIRWKTRRQSTQSAYGTPCVYQPEGGPAELIFCNTADGMYSLDPESGRENWSLRVLDKRTVSSPLVAAGLLFGSVGSGGGGNYLVAVRPGRPPREIYRIKTQAPYVPTSVARDQLLFLWSDRGIVSCIHAPDGKVFWSQRIGGNYFASPVRVGDRVYGVSAEGEVVVLSCRAEVPTARPQPIGPAQPQYACRSQRPHVPAHRVAADVDRRCWGRLSGRSKLKISTVSTDFEGVGSTRFGTTGDLMSKHPRMASMVAAAFWFVLSTLSAPTWAQTWPAVPSGRSPQAGIQDVAR